MYSEFNEAQFRKSDPASTPSQYSHTSPPNPVEKALAQAQHLLQDEKEGKIQILESTDNNHTYQDKFSLAEFITQTSLGALSQSLRTLFPKMTLTPPEKLLVFHCKQECILLQEEEKDVVTHTTQFTEQSSSTLWGNKEAKHTHKVIHKYKEYRWKVTLEYHFTFQQSLSSKDNKQVLHRASSSILLVNGGPVNAHSLPSQPQPPLPSHTQVTHTLDLAWLHQHFPEQICQFQIDRNTKQPITPRRNTQVSNSIEFHRKLDKFASQIFKCFRDVDQVIQNHTQNPVSPQQMQVHSRCRIVQLQKEPSFNGKIVIVQEILEDRCRVTAENPHDGLPATMTIKPSNLELLTTPQLSSLSQQFEVFSPTQPFMQQDDDTSTSIILSDSHANLLLQHQSNTLTTVLSQIAAMFPPQTLEKVITVTEATVSFVMLHLQQLCADYINSMEYLEFLMKEQFIQAIGKEVSSHDFIQFMKFHAPRILTRAPSPMVYAIRRPHAYPDGILSVEQQYYDSTSSSSFYEPIDTMVRHVAGSTSAPVPSIYLPISAACQVEMTGDRYLHGWMQYRFESSPTHHRLVARARQFSSFMLIVGTMAGADRFQPKNAIILQNKDEILIPLLTDPLPSAKDFKDAIASLSPEQQAFAKGYRSMQLESSVFGVCVVQLKPQLEKLLGLPNGALTKEIQLTQDLLSLFVEYQIPSDLLSYDGPTNATQAEKLEAVRGYVKKVLDVIDSSKEKQLLEEERKADMRYEMSETIDLSVEECEEDGYAPGGSSSVAKKKFGGMKNRRKLGSSPPKPPVMASPPMMMAGLVQAASAALPTERMEVSSSFSSQQTPVSKQISVKKETVQPVSSRQNSTSSSASSSAEDFTMIPKKLDGTLERLDTDNSLRSTIIKTGPTWTLNRQENLLTPIKSSQLRTNEIEVERKRAFDLLDAISRSGTLSIDCAELHIFVCVSHCFENTVMGTIIQDNINPIEKVEKSSLILASTIHGEKAAHLIQHRSDADRLALTFPEVFEETD